MKMTAFEATVREVVRETPDTVTLVLDVPPDCPPYKAGQYCAIDPRQFPALRGWADYLEQQKGRRELARSYSVASAPHEPHLALTVKEEPFVAGTTRYPPLLTPLLVHHAQPGWPLQLTGFAGAYTVPDDLEQRTSHLVHVVAGSGAVPNFSLLKHCLQAGLKVRHTFIDSNKTFADICYRKELESLERAHPDRLRVVHTLTREENEAAFGPTIRRGRVSLELFRELIPDPDTCLVYACGPAVTAWERKAAREQDRTPTPRFLETVISSLVELGVAGVRIKRESYG